jgi:hypothetical protein
MPMGEPRGFMKYERKVSGYCAGHRPTQALQRVPHDPPAGGGQDAGRPLHGLRRALLPHRLPAGEHHPRLQRPRVSPAMARGQPAAACHQQLPGVHRPRLPRSLRGGLRARHQRGSGRDQADRDGDRRQAWDEGWVVPEPPNVRTGKRVAVVGSGPPGSPRRSSSTGPAIWSPSSSGPTGRAAC